MILTNIDVMRDLPLELRLSPEVISQLGLRCQMANILVDGGFVRLSSVSYNSVRSSEEKVIWICQASELLAYVKGCIFTTI